MKTFLLLSVTLIAGCGTPRVLQMSADTYMITKASAAGMFANLPSMKSDVVRQATDYAEKQGKAVEPISMHDTFPTHGFPSVEYQFRLVPLVVTNK